MDAVVVVQQELLVQTVARLRHIPVILLKPVTNVSLIYLYFLLFYEWLGSGFRTVSIRGQPGKSFFGCTVFLQGRRALPTELTVNLCWETVPAKNPLNSCCHSRTLTPLTRNGHPIRANEL